MAKMGVFLYNNVSFFNNFMFINPKIIKKNSSFTITI